VPAESFTFAYRLAMAATAPIVRQWGRLHVSGVEVIPESGPLLIAANHDSYWDPLAVGAAALGRRQIRALAKSELWKIPVLPLILNGMGQIPVDRGASDARAMSRAIEELRRGACIGIFPEGTRSRGRELRARSGLGRLAQAVPEAEIVCATVVGAVDIPKFPTRPAIRVEFFRPSGGGIAEGETPAEFGTRLLLELRARAPIAAAGRRRRRVAS
jgi:1-acyl-sn-glycerol-3-phosphate acyltransferase